MQAVFRQPPPQIDLVAALVGENGLRPQQCAAVQVKSRSGFGPAPVLGGVNALKDDIGNTTGGRTDRPQKIRSLVIGVVGQPKMWLEPLQKTMNPRDFHTEAE